MCNSAIVCTSAGEQASEQETERERVCDVRLHIRSRIVRLTPRHRPPPPRGVACACNACTYCMRSAYKCQVWQPIWPLNKTPCSLSSARRLLRLRASGATKYLDFFFFLLGRKARGGAIRRHHRLFIAAHPARAENSEARSTAVGISARGDDIFSFIRRNVVTEIHLAKRPRIKTASFVRHRIITKLTGHFVSRAGRAVTVFSIHKA